MTAHCDTYGNYKLGDDAEFHTYSFQFPKILASVMKNF